MSQTVTAQQMDAILQYLPIFDHPEECFTEIPSTKEGNTISFGGIVYSDAVGAFLKALYRQDFFIQINWPEWQGQAQMLFEHPELLKQATLETLRKLLWLHVRKERFCEGHLMEMIQTGHIKAILERLKELRQSMPEEAGK